MIVLWAALSTVGVLFTEYLFRASGEWRWEITLPLAALTNFCVFKMLNVSSSWMGAIILFSLMTQVGRLGLGYLVLHEPMTKGLLAGIMLLLAANVVRSVWR